MTTENGLIITPVTGGETRSYVTNPNEWMGNVHAETDPVTGGIGLSSSGADLTPYSFAAMLTPGQVGSRANKTVWATAVAANAAKVAYVGHSIVAGQNQAFAGAELNRMLQTCLWEAFPNVAFTFGNYGIGGTTASQFVTSHPNITVAAPSAHYYREAWQNDSGALTSAHTWADKVAAFAPDLIFLQFDLNETSASTFATEMQGIIDDINGNARWVAKRPSIVLIASHTGANNTTVIRACHKVLRSIARRNGLPLIDAGRIYDVLTQGSDPASPYPLVTGETAFRGLATAASNLPSAYFESKVGTAYSPTGTSVRDSASGNSLRFYRNQLTADGAVQTYSSQLASASTSCSLFYRADPTDPNYATGTGAQYEVRVTGTALQVYYWPSGSAVAISTGSFRNWLNGVPQAASTGAALTLTTGTTAAMTLRAEFKGGRHFITTLSGTSEVRQLEFYDYQNLAAGYIGLGYGGTGGTSFEVGQIAANQPHLGTHMEFWSTPTGQYAPLSDSDILGSTNDWLTNYDSVGGNTTNHPTMPGYKLVYEHAFRDVMRALQT